MSQRTPGPWRVGDSGMTIFGPPRAAPSPLIVANVANRADAPVLAASLTMLAVLDQVVREVECYCTPEGVANTAPCAHCMAKAAIAKGGGA